MSKREVERLRFLFILDRHCSLTNGYLRFSFLLELGNVVLSTLPCGMEVQRQSLSCVNLPERDCGEKMIGLSTSTSSYACSIIKNQLCYS